MNKVSLICNDVEIERQLFTKTNMHAYCISLKMKNFQSKIHYQLPINYYNVTCIVMQKYFSHLENGSGQHANTAVKELFSSSVNLTVRLELHLIIQIKQVLHQTGFMISPLLLQLAFAATFFSPLCVVFLSSSINGFYFFGDSGP